ncbi:hypothetical protein C0995_002525 [Termitomyces sp. Mi166|nr:hypothetical protein C0995_002525 [Termitomyces sp. Mi166\
MPEGFRFGAPLTYDMCSYRDLKWRNRSSARPMQYYFIDFDISKQYPVDEKIETSTGLSGQDRTVPEMLDNKPYDPFKVDVYQLGNAFLAKVVPEYNGLNALLPILKAMTNARPEDRPSPSEALRMLGPYDDRTLQRRVWLKKYSISTVACLEADILAYAAGVPYKCPRNMEAEMIGERDVNEGADEDKGDGDEGGDRHEAELGNEGDEDEKGDEDEGEDEDEGGDGGKIEQ